MLPANNCSGNNQMHSSSCNYDNQIKSAMDQPDVSVQTELLNGITEALKKTQAALNRLKEVTEKCVQY
jgi:hypothetical protein